MSTAKQITMLITVGLVALCGSAQAFLMFTNSAPAGASWFTAGNWHETVDPNVSVVPNVNHLAYISSSGGSGRVIVDGPGAVVDTLNLGWAGFQADLIILPEGELHVKSSCSVGFYSPSQFVITGGVFSGLDRLYIGSYAWSQPPVAVEVIQYGGTVFLTNGYGEVYMNPLAGHQNYLPGYPRYRLVNGMINSGYWYIGQHGYAKFEIEDGTNYVRNNIHVGYQSGGDGVFLHSGGRVDSISLNIGNSGAQGRYELSGGWFNDRWYGINCGNGGEGTFIQSGGTTTLEGFLSIGTQATGTGHCEISGGKLAKTAGIIIGTNGTLKIIGGDAEILCRRYTQHAHGTLDLSLTNGVVSPITVEWSNPTTIGGTLNVTLLGSPDSYPDRSSVVTVMTYTTPTGTFDTINLAPANKLLSVRVNYNANSITLDQWKYAPNGTLLVVR